MTTTTRLLLLALLPLPVLGAPCDNRELAVQILGSGGPSLSNGRAASGYLIWHQGKSRFLLDAGPGTARHFFRAGGRIEDLSLIALSHLHADHTGDLPALMNAARQSPRKSPLRIYGPEGNKFMPGTVSFMRLLFDEKRGAWRHLGTYLSPLGDSTFKLAPHDLPARFRKLPAVGEKSPATSKVFEDESVRIDAHPVHHDNAPTLAWRMRFGGKVIAFTSDISGHNGDLKQLADSASILVAHHQYPERPSDKARLRPSDIGHIAYLGKVGQLILSHRGRETLGQEKATMAAIKAKYSGLVSFANDLDCFEP